MTALFPLISFTFVMSITPGPNNIMLWASGANYGFKRSLPHMLGISIGFASLFLVCGLGLGALFEAYPVIQTVLKVVGSVYLLYLAFRIATASFEGKQEDKKPLNFFEAAGFQYANPKAWVFALTTASSFSLLGSNFILNALSISLVLMLVNFPCICVWTAFGTAIGRFLSNKRALMSFNFVMAGLLVATILLIL